MEGEELDWEETIKLIEEKFSEFDIKLRRSSEEEILEKHEKMRKFGDVILKIVENSQLTKLERHYLMRRKRYENDVFRSEEATEAGFEYRSECTRLMGEAYRLEREVFLLKEKKKLMLTTEQVERMKLHRKHMKRR